MEWKEVRLGDVCTRVCSGGTPKSTNLSYYGGEIPWLNTKEIDFNRIYSTEKTITDSGLNNSSAKWIVPNTVTVAMYGATAGKSCIVKVPMTTNQACCNLTINDEVADYEFVYYTLKNDYTTLASLANGGAQQNLNAQIIKDYVLKMPSLADQRRIASILSSLDRKIELNNKINADLEEMAQAIFKNWFVDFEPFKNGKFVDSELGMIPEGWKVVTLDDLTSKFGTGLNPRKNFVLGHGNNYYVTIKNMGNNRIYLNDRCDKVDDEALAKINKRSKLQKGDLLFSGIGTIGRVAMVVDDPINWNTSESVFNMHPIDTVSSEFIYLLLLSDKFQQYVQQNAQGGVQQGIRMASLKAFQFAIPNDLKLFDNLVKPIISKVKSNDKENDTLSLLRDTLLPRLMSGELEVPE
ncbi:MAG: restriction endonuclease subunit S [Prevotella sp.]